MEIKITYAYDGTHFYGLQKQKDRITVQGEIEKVILKAFNEKINLVSSGRTDAKVHALGQVSNFNLETNIPLNSIKNQINKNLFGMVKVNEIEYVNEDFNSRYDAKKRVYEYRFKAFKNISPFEANYVSAIKNEKLLDLDSINEKLKLFIGIHDFTSFSKKDKKIDFDKNPIREIYNAYCYKENDTFIAIIEGQSFLRAMIRLIMAASIYESKETILKRLNLELIDIPKKIVSPNGLYLKEVIYE